MFHEIVQAICERTKHLDAAEASEGVRAAREVAREALGVVAYECYCQSTDGKSAVTGVVLPEWGKLRPEIQQAWRDSAAGVSAALLSAVEGLIGE